MRTRSILRHTAHGALMGAADVVPGVSGGTMALIVGVYRRLVASIRAAASLRLREVEWDLVLPLAVGIAAAVALGTIVIPPLLDAFPPQSRAVFLGLVAASMPIPWRGIRRRGRTELALVAVAAVVAFVLVGVPPRAIEDPAAWQAAVAASVAICAMILPGVSGAFLLEAMGMYEATLQAARELDVGYVAAFAAGAVVGLAAFSRLLGWLLEHRHDVTMAALVGLMGGSLRALWPWLAQDGRLLAPPPDVGHAVLVVALAAAGFFFVTALVVLGARREASMAPAWQREEASGR